MVAKKFLTPDQLVEYVKTVASRPKLWKHLVADVLAGEKRGYKELADTPKFNCWVITWNEGHDTGMHDHDGSAGGVIVVEGEVWESRLKKAKPVLCSPIEEKGQTYEKGQTFQFGPWDIHRVTHEGRSAAVTIHAYSPPLIRMGSYGFVDDEFRRMPSTKEELRPLEQVIKDGG